MIRLSFFIAAVAVFICAVVPHAVLPASPHLAQGYKGDHLIAFFVLTLFAVAAFPATRLMVIGALLSGFGGTIELAQAMPLVARDSDYRDWLIDSLAVLAALTPIMLARWPASDRSRARAMKVDAGAARAGESAG
jgi:hypothetical protein